ncbi:GNAT family N-acetyltransferase [Actinomadura opuntiae]|uniref:GNAT family N-acetyltransferase n=1 Tax=Actinomadura sp. OS1-43 TaxID=604315 RepID=UPI00255ABF84|nr:GNAT family N-acetyltransferase [Actinomadura sp. OS1-43]MDL4812776.1 GNAT family N-acetyltransferase [Actinomadura sp. OS1-43]
MRPATVTDKAQVARLAEARCSWLEERNEPSWRDAVEDLVAQCDNPSGDVWVLADHERGVIGQMLVQDVGPPWGWTDAERAEPALYLSGSITDPTAPAIAGQRPGTVMAWWAVDRAARLAVPWVRRHCQVAAVARYNLTQGFELVREEQRTSARLYFMARRAERLDLSAWFGPQVRTGTP